MCSLSLVSVCNSYLNILSVGILLQQPKWFSSSQYLLYYEKALLTVQIFLILNF